MPMPTRKQCRLRIKRRNNRHSPSSTAVDRVAVREDGRSRRVGGGCFIGRGLGRSTRSVSIDREPAIRGRSVSSSATQLFVVPTLASRGRRRVPLVAGLFELELGSGEPILPLVGEARRSFGSSASRVDLVACRVRVSGMP